MMAKNKYTKKELDAKIKELLAADDEVIIKELSALPDSKLSQLATDEVANKVSALVGSMQIKDKSLRKQILPTLPKVKQGWYWTGCYASEYESKTGKKIPARIKKQILKGDWILYAEHDPYLVRKIGRAWVIIDQWD